MRKQTIDENRRRPKCGQAENQVNAGKNRSGTQRCICRTCNYKYTTNKKSWEYPEETKQLAIKTYLSGVSGTGVGKIFHMNKANVVRWIKKNERSVDKSKD